MSNASKAEHIFGGGPTSRQFSVPTPLALDGSDGDSVMSQDQGLLLPTTMTNESWKALCVDKLRRQQLAIPKDWPLSFDSTF
jgi:hypothetical protein